MGQYLKDVMNINKRNKDYKTALEKGIEVEREHAPTLEKVKDSIVDNELTMSDEEFYASIAKDHLNERLDYYDLLEKYVEKHESSETEKKDWFSTNAARVKKRKNYWIVYNDGGDPVGIFPDKASATSLKNEIERANWFKRTREWIHQKRKKTASIVDDIDSLLELVEHTDEKFKEALTHLKRVAYEEVPLPREKRAPQPEQVGLTKPVKYPPDYDSRVDVRPKQVERPNRDVVEKYDLFEKDMYKDTEGYGKWFKYQQNPWMMYDPKMPSGLPDAPGEWYTTTELDSKREWFRRSAQILEEIVNFLKKKVINNTVTINEDEIRGFIENVFDISPTEEALKNLIDKASDRLKNEGIIIKEPEEVELSPAEEIANSFVTLFYSEIAQRGYPMFWSEFYSWARETYPTIRKEYIEEAKNILIKRGFIWADETTTVAEEMLRKLFDNITDLLKQIDSDIGETASVIDSVKRQLRLLRTYLREYVYDWTTTPPKLWLLEVALPATEKEITRASIEQLLPQIAILKSILEELKVLMKEGQEHRNALYKLLPLAARSSNLIIRNAQISTTESIRIITNARAFVDTFSKRFDAIKAKLDSVQRTFESSIGTFDYIGDLIKRKEVRTKEVQGQREIPTPEDEWLLLMYERINELEEAEEKLVEKEELEKQIKEEFPDLSKEEIKEFVEEEWKAIEEQKENIEREIVELKEEIKEMEKKTKEEVKELGPEEVKGLYELELEKRKLLEKYPWISDYNFEEHLILFNADRFPEDYQLLKEKINDIRNLLAITEIPKERAILEKQLESLNKDFGALEEKYIGSFREAIEPLQKQYDNFRFRYAFLNRLAKIPEFEKYIEEAKKENVNIVKADWIIKILEDYPGWKTDISKTKELVNETLKIFDAVGFNIIGKEKLEEIAEGLEKV